MSAQPLAKTGACSGTLPWLPVLSAWVLFLGSSAFLGSAIASSLSKHNPSAGAVLALALVVDLWLGWYSGRHLVRRAEASEEGLRVRLLGFWVRELRWQEVSSAQWENSYAFGYATQLLILRGQSPRTRVQLTNRLSHFEELVAYVGAHLPPTVELPPRPPL